MRQKISSILNGRVAEEIRHGPALENFLVIANFAYEEDHVTSAPVNIYSGLSEMGFDALISHSAEAHGIAVLYTDGNTAILGGLQPDLKAVERDCGPLFSYAYCSEEGALKVMDRCLEAARETPEEQDMRHIPGARDLVRHLN